MRWQSATRGTVLAAAAATVLATASLAACTSSSSPSSPASSAERASGGPSGTYLVGSGIHKIKHVIIVMQENRSFDT